MTLQAPDKITVQAGAGRIVRLQDKRVLKPGMPAVRVPWSVYLQRRLDCGDLVAVEAQAQAPAKAAPPAAPAPEPTKGTAP